ncbi:MAG: ABC transporter permease subunit [Chloroflexota bacterium]|nr:ABC transporter permease subunit [Chloroflexota bacterium]
MKARDPVFDTLKVKVDDSPQSFPQDLAEALRLGAISIIVLLIAAFLFSGVIGPLFALGSVEETVTDVLTRLALLAMPFVAYISGASVARRYTRSDIAKALGLAFTSTVILFALISAGYYVLDYGVFAPRPSLQMTLSQTEAGIRVDAVVAGGAAETAGLQVGDVISAIRRDAVDLAAFNKRLSQSMEGDPLRLRFTRGDEELQETARVVLVTDKQLGALLPGLALALAFTAIIVFLPGHWAPYIALVGLLSPLIVGYFWVIIATFSFRTEGLVPLDGNDNFGGFTLKNWESIFVGNIAGLEFNIVPIFMTSLAIAVLMTFVVLLVSSMAGYALSRMHFPGRRFFLSFTLILHGFPAITLLIPIFIVLLRLGNIPVIGELIGFNTVGGIALVMVAFQLPLGVWLMKGFFDNIPWDMERSALIDGASRWRTYWEILLPQIRPGLLALGIFAFIGGWNAYIIPATYSIGSGVSNLPVFLNELIDETAPVDWNQVAAVGLFQLIPIFIFFIFAQEYLLNIYAGGTKGSS